MKDEFLLQEKKEEENGEVLLFDELLLEIFLHMDLKTLVACSVVCKKWHLYTNLESVWKNKANKWFENYVNQKKFAQAHIAPWFVRHLSLPTDSSISMDDIQKLASQSPNMWKSYQFFLERELQQYCFQKVNAVNSMESLFKRCLIHHSSGESKFKAFILWQR